MVDALSYFLFQPVPHVWCNKGRSGVTESLFGVGVGGRPSSGGGGGARGRHHNEGCTIKCQMV